jgi:phospholipid transport system substrate-binding protein
MNKPLRSQSSQANFATPQDFAGRPATCACHRTALSEQKMPNFTLPMLTLSRRPFLVAGAAALGLVAMAQPVRSASAAQPPDALIREVSAEVIDIVKGDAEIQAGNIDKIIALVDGKIMPHVNFARMTAIAVGRPWRSATPPQRERLQAEFKTLLVRTYAGALTQVKDQTLQLKPVRATADTTDLVVRSELKGKGQPIQLDYRMEKTADGWKIYDVNVLGVWLADTSFKSQFAPIVANSGIDGLIGNLAELNRRAAAARN